MARTFRDEFRRLDQLILGCTHQEDQIWTLLEKRQEEIRDVALSGGSPDAALIKTLAYLALGGLLARKLETHKALMEGAKDNYLEQGGSLDDPLNPTEEQS